MIEKPIEKPSGGAPETREPAWDPTPPVRPPLGVELIYRSEAALLVAYSTYLVKGQLPVETAKPQARMGMGSWFLAGMVVVALFGIITLVRRRKTRMRASIPDFTGAQDLKPVLAERH